LILPGVINPSFGKRQNHVWPRTMDLADAKYNPLLFVLSSCGIKQTVPASYLESKCQKMGGGAQMRLVKHYVN
jgi:hypothetical protein